MIAQLLELGPQLVLLRRHHGDRRLFAGGWCRHGCGHLIALAGSREARAHDLLLDLTRAAVRAGDELLLGLLVVGRGALEPAFEGVPLRANERVADHRGSPTARNLTGSARGSVISKRRPCCREGTRPRALATAAGSTLATTTPGSTPPSARMRPHGSTMSEWP